MTRSCRLMVLAVLVLASPAAADDAMPVRERFRLAEGVELEFVRIRVNAEDRASVSVITNEQYQLAVDAGAVASPALPVELRETPCATVAWSKGKLPEGQKDCAVLFVTHKEASAYCAWLGKKSQDFHFRLPTFVEACEIGNRGVEAFIGRHPDSFPRPVKGTEALSGKAAFWMAPTTLELNSEEVLHTDAELRRFKELAAMRGDGSFTSPGRYRERATSAPGRPTVTPTAFRVVAIPLSKK
ncbi:MAG: SUMF1/EgtB/PvdO family nonheme iron enzyme [Gemmataceae bacterium]